MKAKTFNAQQIQAIQDGRLVEFREPIKKSTALFDGGPWPNWIDRDEYDWEAAFVDEGPSPAGNAGPYLKLTYPGVETGATIHRIYPKLFVGDLIWCRETWVALRFYRDYESGVIDDWEPCDPKCVKEEKEGPFDDRPYAFIYRADGHWEDDPPNKGFSWRSPVTMPRCASRLTLEVISVRCERVQSVNGWNALKAGIDLKDARAGREVNIDGEYTERYLLSKFRELWQSRHPGSWERNDWVWVYEFKVVE